MQNTTEKQVGEVKVTNTVTVSVNKGAFAALFWWALSMYMLVLTRDHILEKPALNIAVILYLGFSILYFK